MHVSVTQTRIPKDYFEGVERLLKTTAPTEVSKNSNFGKSALKKVIKEYNAKDIRKIVDVLFKRVEKHFVESSDKMPSDDSGGVNPETVISGVWKACEEELVRLTDVSNKRIAQCYSETGLSLEYSVADVEAAFRRHK
jgi:exocyst complex component 1